MVQLLTLGVGDYSLLPMTLHTLARYVSPQLKLVVVKDNLNVFFLQSNLYTRKPYPKQLSNRVKVFIAKYFISLLFFGKK